MLTILLLVLTWGAPCVTEDSSWCVWNAPTQGDGTGHSFIALQDSVIWID